MDIEKCKRRPRRARTRHITIRVSEDVIEWLHKNKYSPTGIFLEAVNDLKTIKKS